MLRRYAVQNSKCGCWCRLRGSASFISPLNWTELGLKNAISVCRRFGRMTGYSSGIGLGKSCRPSRSYPAWELELRRQTGHSHREAYFVQTDYYIGEPAPQNRIRTPSIQDNYVWESCLK